MVAGRVEDRLHEPPRRFPAHLDDERERLARAEAPQAAAAGRLPGRPTARASPSSTTTDGDDEIYTVGADGKGVTQLTENTGIADDSPTWSPDSSMLAFASNRDSDGDIFEMHADGSAVRVLVSGVWTDDSPAWRR